MTHPHRRPRNDLAILLEAAKRRSGLEWWQIELSLDLHKGSREAWLNGKVSKPPLYGVCRLAGHLGITGNELMDCIIKGEMPDWVPAVYVETQRAAFANNHTPVAAPETKKARPPRGSGVSSKK